MSDFNKRLDEASKRGQEFVRTEKEAENAARQLKMDEAKKREEATHEAESVAMGFENRLKDTLSAIAERLRATHTDGRGGEGFRRQALTFGQNEYFEMRANYGPSGVTLSIEACCRDDGVVHVARLGPIASADFNEEKAQEWMEEQAARAIEEFTKKATVVRNPPAIVAYKGKTSQ